MSVCEAACLCRETVRRSCMILCCRRYIASTVPRSGIGVHGHLSPWHVGHEMQEVRPPSLTASAPGIEPSVSLRVACPRLRCRVARILPEQGSAAQPTFLLRRACVERSRRGSVVGVVEDAESMVDHHSMIIRSSRTGS